MYSSEEIEPLNSSRIVKGIYYFKRLRTFLRNCGIFTTFKKIFVDFLILTRFDWIIPIKIRWTWANDFHLRWKIIMLNNMGEEAYFKYLDEGSIFMLNNFYEVDFNMRDKICVDVGCGVRGFLTVIEANEKIGVDPIIERAKEYFNLQKDIRYLSEQGENISLSNGYSNVVFCNNVLNHAEEPAKIVEEIHRILDTDGLLMFMINLERKSYNHTHYIKHKEIKEIINHYFEPIIEKHEKYKQFLRYGGVFTKLESQGSIPSTPKEVQT